MTKHIIGLTLKSIIFKLTLCFCDGGKREFSAKQFLHSCLILGTKKILRRMKLNIFLLDFETVSPLNKRGQNV